MYRHVCGHGCPQTYSWAAYKVSVIGHSLSYAYRRDIMEDTPNLKDELKDNNWKWVLLWIIATTAGVVIGFFIVELVHQHISRLTNEVVAGIVLAILFGIALGKVYIDLNGDIEKYLNIKSKSSQDSNKFEKFIMNK